MKKYHAFAALLLAAVLTLSAGAAFTPSVEYKKAPQVVEKVDEEGNVTVGEIRDESGEVVASVPAGAITITPISAVKTSSTAVTTEKPETASAPAVDAKVEESLKAVEAEITAEFEKAADSELVQTVSRELNGAPAENIVVSDVFAVTATPEIEEVLASGATLSVAVTSQNITKEDETKIAIYQKDAVTGEWKQVPFTIAEDGVITLELTSAGEVVIFRDNEAAPVTPEEAPVSPSTKGDRALAAKKSFIKRH